MSLLDIKNVNKVYNGGIKALNNISFSVNEGEFISIIGSSGAGKSTLLRCINRLIDTSTGSIMFDGQEVTTLNKNELRKSRTKTGMIFQHYNLVERLSVVENVLHGRLGYKSTFSGVLGNYTEEEKARAFEILEELGLLSHAYSRCSELSGGQKQRVGIARAIIQNPKLILCDEPIASLDPNSAKIIMEHLKNINIKMKITCILNLHQVDVAIKYSDRIIGISDGEIIYDGSSDLLDVNMIHKIYKSTSGDLIMDSDKSSLLASGE